MSTEPSQNIELGVNVTTFTSGLKSISNDEWSDICSSSYSQEEFEEFINEKSIDAKLPPKDDKGAS